LIDKRDGSGRFSIVFQWKPFFGNHASPQPLGQANGVKLKPENAEDYLNQPKFCHKSI
jgi:hypothetical protein